MNWLKREGLAVLIVLGSVFLFLPEILFLAKGFLSGDHRQQHYPWFYFLWNQIRSFQLPWWTTFNQCGFPLLAEGQIGALYPLNLLLCLLLPVKAAYNYSVLLHYVLGGIFFYAYCRRIKLESLPSLWATFVFLYGSTQGGFFYNITSQRVLIWFPLGLLLIHQMMHSRRWKDALSLGVVFAIQVFAGYQQYAVYSFLFSLVYFIILWVGSPDRASLQNRLKLILLFCGGGLFSVLVALPQWVPFLELTRYSAREQLTEEFAYLASMNPLGPLTLIFPGWQGILGTELYVGILGLFFVLWSLSGRGTKVTYTHWILVGLSLVLALGRFSPVYVALVKATHFYGFRTPVKLVFFTGFSLAVLSGFGLQLLLLRQGQVMREKFSKGTSAFSIFFGVLFVGVCLGNVALRAWKLAFLNLLDSLVQKYVIGQPYRFASPEVYLAKARSFYELLLSNVNPLNPWILTTGATFLISSLVLLWVSRQRKRFDPFVPWLLLGVLYLDLYAYGYKNIRTDYESFSFVERDSKIATRLKGDSSMFRLYVFNADRPREEIPLVSNSNIMEGVENVGIYSPLAWRVYKELLGPLGDVDDSVFLQPSQQKALDTKMDLLRFLNVKYVLGTRELSDPRLKEVQREGTSILYETKDPLPRYLFVRSEDFHSDNLDSVIRKGEPVDLKVIRYLQDRATLLAEFTEAGYLISSELNYPGWRARIDGRGEPIANFLGLFRVVAVSPGQHTIEMAYRPPYWAWVNVLSVSGLCLYFFLLMKEPSRL